MACFQDSTVEVELGVSIVPFIFVDYLLFMWHFSVLVWISA
jgi:hypothetical protein